MISVCLRPVPEEYASEHVEGEHAERDQQSARPCKLMPVFIGAHGELEYDHGKVGHGRIHVGCPELVVEGGEEKGCRLAADARNCEQDTGDDAGFCGTHGSSTITFHCGAPSAAAAS